MPPALIGQSDRIPRSTSRTSFVLVHSANLPRFTHSPCSQASYCLVGLVESQLTLPAASSFATLTLRATYDECLPLCQKLQTSSDGISALGCTVSLQLGTAYI